jgi:hypothetical protein
MDETESHSRSENSFYFISKSFKDVNLFQGQTPKDEIDATKDG